MADPIATVVIAREGGVVPEHLATRGEHVPDIIVWVMSPIAVVLVRALRVYLQTIASLLTVGVASNAIPALVPLASVITNWKVAASFAAGPAFYCALQNTIELLARLDEKLPQLRP